MKKHFLALIAACSVLAACNGTPKPEESNPDNKQQAQSLVSDADGAEAPPNSSPTPASSSFVPKMAAQAMIDAYDSNPMTSQTTKYYLADAGQIKAYLDYAQAHDIKDVQLIFARNDEDQVTLVITGVKSDGSHILYPDPNNNNTPSVIEHVYPCPPGTNCYTSTNLSQ